MRSKGDVDIHVFAKKTLNKISQINKFIIGYNFVRRTNHRWAAYINFYDFCEN